MLLSELVKQLESELSAYNRMRTMKAYTTTLRSVSSFTRREVNISEVFNPTWVWKYQSFLMRKGLKKNTISFYMRMLRSIYNKAVDRGLYINVPRLFFRVFTGLSITNKRSISPELIYTIARGRISKQLEFCRDIFMLCFYLQGMTFIDLAYLKKTDIQGDCIIYCRKKSKSQITVAIRNEAKKIIERYTNMMVNSEYVFPIITDPKRDDRVQYQSALRTQNRHLKKLAKELNLNITLSSYVARHSWATMAYHNRVPTAIISEAMGHKTEEVTRIYLASFGLEKLSQANEIVVKAMKREGKKGKKKTEKKICPSLTE